jgi:prepilin-type N-terminal cleavage/methylation domain-containing protein
MKRARAFTLIELLVVIAIIGILAAITFPVFGRVKLNAYKSGDMSSMNSIRSALQLYREDQGAFPTALLGYINPYQYRNGVTIVPADQVRGALYPKRIDSLDTMKGSINRVANNILVPAAWPPVDPRAVGSAPIRDLDSNGVINAADDTGGARQAYGSDYPGNAISYYRSDPELNPNIGFSTSSTDTVVGRFYASSGYDVAPVKAGAATVYELRYSLFWTVLGVGSGSANDDPRQLGYSEPPENTVVTWNSFYRDYSSGGLTNGGSKDMVLFLGGAARPVDSKLMSERSWRLDR